MSLDVYLTKTIPTRIFSANITHNLYAMANEANIGMALWHPEEIGVTKAEQLIPLLKNALLKLKSDPDFFRKFDARNGWGLYEHFVSFVEKYLAACEENPDAEVTVSR